MVCPSVLSTREEFSISVNTLPTKDIPSSRGNIHSKPDVDFKEKTVSAAGAAFLSAIIVNPLDVAKTRLQAQAAGVNYNQQIPSSLQHKVVEGNGKCPPVCPRAENIPLCPPDCYRYKSTFDVFSKVIRQEGLLRLWRGTDAALAIAIPTVGIYLPCYDVLHEWLLDVSKSRSSPYVEKFSPFIAGTMARSLACIVCGPIELARTRMQAFKEVHQPPGVWATMVATVSSGSGSPLRRARLLWTGVGAQLARDVPFSAICWSTLEPTRQILLAKLGSDNASGILASNIGAGVLAGSIAAAATCPLDVVKTRMQIVDPSKKPIGTMTVLHRLWRNEGFRGLFTGVGPRVARAGPSVGIVVSFYEVMKYFIHQTSHTDN